MQEATWKDARLLIVDDQDATVRFLDGLLRTAGYVNLRGTTDPRAVSSAYTEFQPDLILLDLQMPHLDGFAVMEGLKPLIPPGSYLPVLALSTDITAEVKQRAFVCGAAGVLAKPVDPNEAVLRIKHLLAIRFFHLQLRNQDQILEDTARKRTQELEPAPLEMLERLAASAELRDDETGQHTKRVGQMSAILARNLGLPEDQVELFRRAAPLHDVGKVGIPDRILLKPGGLTPEEFEVIKTHTTIGASILSGARSPLLRMAGEIALTHHERWDGTGYPQGLTGEAIPLSGRIVALADAFDALISVRPYKKARPIEESVVEIKRNSGTQFDPRVADAFLAHTPQPWGARIRLQTSVVRSKN